MTNTDHTPQVEISMDEYGTGSLVVDGVDLSGHIRKGGWSLDGGKDLPTLTLDVFRFPVTYYGPADIQLSPETHDLLTSLGWERKDETTRQEPQEAAMGDERAESGSAHVGAENGPLRGPSGNPLPEWDGVSAPVSRWLAGVDLTGKVRLPDRIMGHRWTPDAIRHEARWANAAGSGSASDLLNALADALEQGA